MSLDYGFSMEYACKTTALIEAIKEFNISKIKECLLNAQAQQKNVRSKLNLTAAEDDNGRNALYWAVVTHVERIELFKVFDSFNVDFEIPYRKNGQTLLMLAIRKKRYDICEFLIKKNAQLNTCDFNRKSAFMIAVEQANKRIIQLLLNEILCRSCVLYVRRYKNYDYHYDRFRGVVLEVAGIKGHLNNTKHQSALISFLDTCKDLIQESLGNYAKVYNILDNKIIKSVISFKIYTALIHSFPKSFPTQLISLSVEYYSNRVLFTYPAEQGKIHAENLLTAEKKKTVHQA